MSRLALFIYALFASVLLSLASPVPVMNGELVNLEARLTRVGRGTWYYPGLGNCGDDNNSSELVLAIGKSLYDQNGGGNCNQYVQITNVANGKTAIGQTKDSCPGCGDNDLDMSPALFEKLGSLSTGVLDISWHFMAKDWKP
ncbi:hypothetical protein CVT26_008813 [Gymnopilus dilepis]|uniref:RlpA-like protein double-psi beta-barrel domain-containing protein n=1 Tax=Gymnopilus dilepis TaxID=231916 RepID=A0A409YSH1_9AGAR|nr:hypothetical protein CVT26_008813 [Gymnopilus dilepis]